MKILVTGAGGFLGSEIVRQALLKGWTVRAMVRPGARLSPLPAPAVERVECELSAPGGDWSAIMQGIDGVVHSAAATTGSRGADWAALSRSVNVEATGRLLEAAERAGVERWVQISTMSAHPASTSAYGATKLAADELLRKRGADSLPRWTILRPSLIYGPGDRGLVARILALARRLPALPMIGSGNERLRPVFVADVADAALRSLELEAAAGQTYPLGGADEVSLDEFMRRLLAAAGLRRPIVHLPAGFCMLAARILSTCVKTPPITVDNVLGVREVQPVDHSRAIRDWGWAPLGLDEGLRRTFEVRS